ncbi:hypothetical protein [Leptolyngbya sp. FACHB-261]|uniref:hypothetical protein n=1 Tax=Leptolyngbya sp. FACHB-261 TaxID=2692806 RepID=UPI001689AE93|nr:hypothetical protein [Leptolyngbya sp. FACHB-261]MBD2100971.1 hypothetical protein [Leptolyngbya sp. FACHB-261]
MRGHSQAVFGIFQGATPDAESRQALARVREPVPRFVWAAPFGPGKIGNGSCHYQDVAISTAKGIKYNIALLKEVDFDLDAQSDPITLRTWARMAARVNTSMWNYREELRRGLETEGHQVAIVTADLTQILTSDFLALCTELSDLLGKEVITQALLQDLKQGILQFPGYEYLGRQHDPIICEQVKTHIVAVRDQNKQQEAIAVASAPDITATEYETLKDQRAKTLEERHVERKHELQRRYPTAITPELKLKDDEGWYPKLRLHYYLTHDPAFVRFRDRKEWQGHIDRGTGKVALQDVRLLTAQVEALRGLSLLSLLDPTREVRAIDPDVQQLARYCMQFSRDIKTLFGLTITEKMKPIEVVQALLSRLGIKLACIGRDVADDGRRGGLRVYQYQPPSDGRAAIFAQWQQQDDLALQGERAAQTALCPALIPTASDPPPDMYEVNHSTSGLRQAEATSQTEQRKLLPSVKLVVDRLAQPVKQACHSGVMQVSNASAHLKQLSDRPEPITNLDVVLPHQLGNSS